MSRLERAMELLAGRGTPRGADEVLAGAQRRAAAGDGDWAGEDGAERRAGGRWPALAGVGLAAAVLLVVGLVVGTGRDDESVPVGTEDGTATTAGEPTTDPDPVSTTTTTEGPEGDGSVELPSTWVGHDTRGRLVVVDTATGEVVRVLYQGDVPADFGDEPLEPVAAGSFLGDVAVSPDGATVWFDVCCEPAPGRILRVPVAGGTSEEVAHGYYPAVSPDGSTVAVVEMQWLALIDVATGDVRRLDWSAEGAEDEDLPMALTRPAWSPDGRWLIFERHDTSDDRSALLLLDVATATSLVDARGFGELTTDAATVTLPVFDRSGRIHVVRQARSALALEPQRDDQGASEGTAEALLVDPDTGEVLHSQPLTGPVTDQSFDATGSWLIRTHADGTVRAQADSVGEQRELGSGYRAAAW